MSRSPLDQIAGVFLGNGWFTAPGAYVLVDGQFGSTGKGALAALIAATCGARIDVVTTNAGPNSGHTGFYTDYAGEWVKVVTRQLPVAGVVMEAQGRSPVVYLNAGAIIDPEVLLKEYTEWPLPRLKVHPCAAMIHDEDRLGKSKSLAAIASTGKGVGEALARKVMRDPAGVVGYIHSGPSGGVLPQHLYQHDWDWRHDVVLVETAQGFSLGINERRFYPFTTSRECTVMQAIADARIPHNKVKKVIACFRTFPIRVGNTDQGESGGGYQDQREITWKELGREPELTTVTQRPRRIFTWSRTQFRAAVAANQPDALFISHMDYLMRPMDDPNFIDRLRIDYRNIMGKLPDFILTGHGPLPTDVKVYE